MKGITYKKINCQMNDGDVDGVILQKLLSILYVDIIREGFFF